MRRESGDLRPVMAAAELVAPMTDYEHLAPRIQALPSAVRGVGRRALPIDFYPCIHLRGGNHVGTRYQPDSQPATRRRQGPQLTWT